MTESKKREVGRITKPAWKTKRFWLNFLVMFCASIDLFTGYIQELLPGKLGAGVLLLIGAINIYLVLNYGRRFRSAVAKGRIVFPED